MRRGDESGTGGVRHRPASWVHAYTAEVHRAPASGALGAAVLTVVVVPCYNEAARLPTAELLGHFESRPDLGVIFVDDGSTDETAEVLRALCEAIGPRATMLRLPVNSGKAEAVRAGLRCAIETNPRYIAFWDADLATPLALIASFEHLLDERPHLLMVLGARVKLLGFDIERRAARHVSGRVFATAASLALRIPVYDTQCGAKMFRVTPDVVAMLAQPFMSRWIFDVEMLARLLARRRRAGDRRPESCMHEFPLPRWQDVRGSRLSARDYVRAAVDLARIWWRYSRAEPVLAAPQPSPAPGLPNIR